MNEFALVLTGGGARGAYQAGVLKGLGEIFQKNNKENPLSIYSGTSAGAINIAGITSFLAQNKDPYAQLVKLWSELNNDIIYKTDTWSFIQNSYRWARSLTMSGRGSDYRLLSLFDASPLAEFLNEILDFDAIHKAIEKKDIKAITVAAVSYATGMSKTFFETSYDISPWQREKRVGVKEKLTLEHVLASSSIPMLFPPVKVGQEYYGDGSLRDYTPLSAPIKMGANKLFVVGVRKRNAIDSDMTMNIPTPGRVLSVVLNGILLDALDLDYERLMRINQTVSHFKDPLRNNLKPVDVFLITPSRKISEIAEEETSSLKGTLRYFVKGLGNLKDSADFISYILFESSYTNKLIELGKHDALSREKEILDFFFSSK